MNRRNIMGLRVIKYMKEGDSYETARVLARYDGLEGKRHL